MLNVTESLEELNTQAHTPAADVLLYIRWRLLLLVVHVLSLMETFSACSHQIYVHHGIHELIFNFVGTLEASQVGVNNHISQTQGVNQ